MMRTILKSAPGAFVARCLPAACLLAALLLAACQNTLSTGNTGDGVTGQVRISFGMDAARTIYPTVPAATAFTGAGYTRVYTFSPGGVQAPDGNGLFILAVGTYTVTVDVYNGPATTAAADKIASGTSASFVLSAANPTANVTVDLKPVTSGTGTGTLAYSVKYPGSIGANLTLKWGLDNGGGLSTLTPGAPSAPDGNGLVTVSEAAAPYAAGFYLLSATLSDALGQTAGRTEVVHIYANMPTTVPAAAFTFTTADFTALLIGSAGITGLTAPATGDTPTALVALTAADTTKYDVTSITWKEGGNTHTGPFAPLATYTAEIELMAKTGYKFTAIAAPLLTTDSVGTPGAGTISADVAENTLTFTVGFNQTTGGTSTVNITLWTNPGDGDIGMSADSATLSRGAGASANLSLNSGYSGYQWTVNGINAGNGSTYIFSSTGRGNGIYDIGLEVTNGGKSYSAIIPITVEN
jgi:hypothetical protein